MPLPTDEKILANAQGILAQFDKLFGLHPGFRPAHAKGTMLTGTFTPAASAAALSKAPHFEQPSTPITVRFSNSTGLPKLPDNDPYADPRGMAVRFNLGEHKHTDIVAHSTDGFPTHTGEEFLGLLEAIATSDPKKPSDPANPSPVEKFLGSHPAALAFVQTPKPAPTSFGRDTYFGVTAFHFANASGDTRFGRYRIVPDAGNEYVDAAELKTKTPEFLFDEIKTRVAAGSIGFKLLAQLAEAGDVVDNATIHWSADRPLHELGTITLIAAVADDVAAQKQIIFDPIPRVEGIEPSADPLLELRAAIYLMSGRRRRAAGK